MAENGYACTAGHLFQPHQRHGVRGCSCQLGVRKTYSGYARQNTGSFRLDVLDDSLVSLGLKDGRKNKAFYGVPLGCSCPSHPRKTVSSSRSLRTFSIRFKKQTLIVLSRLFLPLVSRAIIGHLRPGASSNSTDDYANFGFLYGSIPTTPTVFVFSTQYGEQIDVVSCSKTSSGLLS